MKKTGLKFLSVLLSMLIVTTCSVVMMSTVSAVDENAVETAADETLTEEVTDEIVTDADVTEEFSEETEAATQAATKSRHEAPEPAGAGGSIFCENAAGWGSVNCYMWNDDNDKNSSWPGVKMTSIGDNVWQYDYKKAYKNVIFNDGSAQTTDMAVPSDKNIFNNSTNQWDNFSLSPVKITAFTSSVESPAYTDCTIRFDVTAKSDKGALTYKFSVKDSKGSTTQLYSGSASSATWVPSVVGKYTVTVDVSDTAGNTNSRKMEFEIGNSATLETAFLRSFGNSLGTLGQIKQNTAITFTADAIGGKIGTNLLFYKFVITDPSGNGNVAYYTTKKSYTYTPSKLGKYNFQIYIQNSHNDTIVKEYTYDCVSSITEQATSATLPIETGTDNPTPGKYKLGDVNHDGNVNIKDATTIQKHIAALPVDYIDTSLAVIDTNKDGRITINDCTRIQMLVAYLITSF